MKETGNDKIKQNGFDKGISDKLKSIAKVSRQDLFANSQRSEEGLSAMEVEQKRAACGLNEINYEKAPPWFIQFLQAFVSPFTFVLIIIGTVSLFTDVILQSPGSRDYTTICILSTIIILSSVISFWQQFRSNKAAEELKGMVKTTATVLRKEGGKQEIPIKELVPDDIVVLSAGDMIPGDCRIIQSKDLFISQSALTGESLPVEKSDAPIADADSKSPLQLDNICFMGTDVVSGAASALIISTGGNTYFGSISKGITKRRAETSFDKGVKSVSFLLIRFMLVMVPLVFLINGFLKHDWMEAFLFALAVAVGLTPEMLPMIVTANLAKGALNMSKHKVIVKRLNAIQNLGAMNVLCSDKTGTLTMDKIALERHLNVRGMDDDEVLKWAYLNSFHQTGLKNLMDLAVLEHTEVNEKMKAGECYTKVDEIPFDLKRRRMSVILQEKNNKHLLICKGAVEEMMDVCSFAFEPGENRQLHVENDTIVPMDANMKEVVLNTSKKLNEEGLRVLLVAIKEDDARPLTYSVADESNLILTGFIGFLDPPKPSAKPSLEALHSLRISVKILTGDNDIVSKKICGDVGLPVEKVLLGSDLDNMSEEELQNKADETTIFAKLNPGQKCRVIKSLQAKGHTVGFLGDGINDAGALKDADVGISVDTAVDIAKESADIILLEKDLMVLRDGVIGGRNTFGNIIKYIKMTASSNFGNMFSVVGASALLPFLPMLPAQIIILNLMYDISQISIPWDRMDKDFIDTPQKWNAGGIARFMIYIGPISSIFDYATFALMWFIFKANSLEHETMFQTAWFIESLISQTLIVHLIRTRKIPFIQSWAATPVIILTSLIMAIGIYLPFSPLASSLKMVALPGSYFLWLSAIIFCYCALTQLCKVLYIKKFSQWL